MSPDPRMPIFIASLSIDARSELDHHLDRFTRVHRTVAIGDTVDRRDPIEHATWLDPAFEHVWQQPRQDRGGRRGRRGGPLRRHRRPASTRTSCAPYITVARMLTPSFRGY